MKVIKLDNDKVNFTWSTDWHLAAIPPGRRADDYQNALIGKLEFIRDLTFRIRGASLCGGDVFHVKNAKSPSNGFGLLSAVFRTLRSFPQGTVFGAVGNHDLSYDRMDTLPTQPLGLLIAAGAYYDLNEEPVLFTNEDGSVSVLVETFPYEHGAECLERLLATGPRPEGVTYRIGIVHAYGEPGNGGNTMYGGEELKIGYNQLSHLDFDFLLWGHDHSRKETQEVGNITHVHLGSLARAALETDQTDRPVSCAILSFAADGIRYKEKEIPVKPLEIAFTVADKAVEKVAKSDEVKEFFAEMDEQVGDIESTDPREVLKTICPDEDRSVLDLVQELCEL